MSDQPRASTASVPRTGPGEELPPPDIAAFIRFCHARRQAGWPDLYDEMCAVAARREFNGWDHDALAAHGLTFTLGEMPQLAAWVRGVLASVSDAGERTETARPDPGRLEARPVGA